MTQSTVSRSGFLLGLAVLIVVYVSSCSESSSPWHEEQFIIRVDSLHVPAEVSVDDTLCISFFGIVGSSSDYRFSHFEVEKDSSYIWVTAWGLRRWHEDQAGLPIVVFLDGEEYCVSGLSEGWFRIVVHQPDGAFLPDSVFVAPVQRYSLSRHGDGNRVEGPPGRQVRWGTGDAAAPRMQSRPL
ncbi:MAG: hypothetical protein KAY32_14145 [Candidatus Eisenbacteria sp.]|nr:hypothetical protein [Candidatus Eisenbacteria bacterium]